MAIPIHAYCWHQICDNNKELCPMCKEVYLCSGQRFGRGLCRPCFDKVYEATLSGNTHEWIPMSVLEVDEIDTGPDYQTGKNLSPKGISTKAPITKKRFQKVQK